MESERAILKKLLEALPHEKIEQVKTSVLEDMVVNMFTLPDLLGWCALYSVSKLPWPEVLKKSLVIPFPDGDRLVRGKIGDYKLFVALAEQYGGKLPPEVMPLFTNVPVIKYSPCGMAKLAALYLRNRKSRKP